MSFLLQPILDFPLRELSRHWQDLTALLAPERFINAPEDLKPDLGLHLHRLGFSHFEHIHFVLIPVGLVARVNDTTLTISGGYEIGDETFCASFDFHESLLPQLFAALPEPLITIVKDRLSRFPFQADLRSNLPMVNLDCQLGESVELTHDKTEHFCPFKVVKITGTKA